MERDWPSIRAKEEAQERFLTYRLAGATVKEALAQVGRSFTAYEKWRQDPKFCGRADSIATAVKASKGGGNDFSNDFGAFRKQWFNHDSPWFHMSAIKALEEAEPGSITMVLFPPEHGKSTTLEDYLCWKLAVDPDHRFTIGSETRSHARKMLGRVRNRMSPEGPFPAYVGRFGPFEPQTGDNGYQPWGTEYFNVRSKGQQDERDYNAAAVGMDASMIGTRCDTLMVDDPQSRKTIAQTEKMVETFRQDWLSRPGSKGKTVIWGSRVGVEDFYQAVLDAEIVDTLIKFPAHDHEGNYLWPERYSPKEYERMRRNSGEDGWLRNYMMRPEKANESPFSQEMLDEHANSMRAIWHRPPAETMEFAVALDPGFGINATMAVAFTPGKMIVLGGRRDMRLNNNQEIIGVVRELMDAYPVPRDTIRHLILEDKAFQKGLMRDESLKRLQTATGVHVSGHVTGSEKNDPDIGVASMAAGFLRGEIVLPGSDDDQTKDFRKMLDAELLAWRPGRKGTQLRQDLVMALWFAWLLWRRRRDFVTLGPSNWDRDPVPWNTEKPQLIVPVGAGGWR